MAGRRKPRVEAVNAVHDRLRLPPSVVLRVVLNVVLNVALSLAVFMPVEARADVLSDINTVRIAMCPGNLPRAALQLSPELSRAAEDIEHGATLQDSLAAVGYSVRRAASIDLQGDLGDARLPGLLLPDCSLIANPEFNEVGISVEKNHIWLVLAVERSVPGNAGAVSAHVLSLLNDARSRARRCGSQFFSAARPLMLNPQLGRAAQQHSQEMADYSFMEHKGHDGSTPADRVTQAGYRWTTVGENVAAGQGTVEEAVAGWLASAGHCANIMDAGFSEMGVAAAVNRRDDYHVYWTLSLAAPR